MTSHPFCFAASLGFLILVGCDQPEPNTEQTVKTDTAPDSTAASNDFGSRLNEELKRIDPKADGWGTEAFGNTASEQLKELGEFLSNINAVTKEDLGRLFTPDAKISILRPSEQTLTTTFKGDNFTVRQTTLSAPYEAKPQPLLPIFSRLASPLQSTGHPHTKFKIFRVNPDETSVTTRVLVLLDGHNDTGDSVQINAEWQAIWTKEETPLIKKITLLKYEENLSKTPGGRFFTDSTDALIPKDGPAKEQLSRGLPHWTRLLERDTGVSTNGYNGLSIGDLNGDELEDVYICQTGGIPNRVLLQTADGALIDHSQKSGADWLNDTRTVLIIDLDNDADNDLVLNIPNGIVFMENDGSAHFTKRLEIRSKGAPFGMAAADPDRDGFLDVFICGYGSVWGGVGDYKHHIPLPMHDADNGGTNLFLRNKGSWQFEDQTKKVGFDQNNTRWSLSAAWEDYDNDGDIDLYVANDFGRNNLYRNDSEPGEALRFVDVAKASGSEDLSPSMSASWGDADNDGKPDLYVSNMFSGAGNRITTQAQFMTSATQQTRDNFLRMSRGNTLLQGTSNGFQDISNDAGITVGRWAWASRMVDINNDGWQDILVANGFMTGEDPADL